MNRKDVVYIGVFLENIPGTLERQIADQHVTLAFSPNQEKYEKLHEVIGTECKMELVGYGNDGQNEGLKVKLISDVPYFGADNPHITLSLADGAKAVKTANLDFSLDIPERLGVKMGEILEGKIGVFTQKDGIKYDKSEFELVEQTKGVAKTSEQQKREKEAQRLAAEKQKQEMKYEMAKRAIDDGKSPLYTQCDFRGIQIRENGGNWKRANIGELKRYNPDEHENTDIALATQDKNEIILEKVEDLAFVDGVLVIETDSVLYSNLDFVQEYQQILEHQMDIEESLYEIPEEIDLSGR